MSWNICGNYREEECVISLRKTSATKKSDFPWQWGRYFGNLCGSNKYKSCNLIILSFYSALSVDLNRFLRGLDATLKSLHNPKSEFLICGIINKQYQWTQIKETNGLNITTYNMKSTINTVKKIQISLVQPTNIFVFIPHQKWTITPWCPVAYERQQCCSR